MTDAPHQGTLAASIVVLSLKKQLAFALLVLERMWPDLSKFSAETGFNDRYYTEAKEEAWAALLVGRVSPRLKDICDRTVPDTEDYSHELTSYALNAALATTEIMEFTSDNCTTHIANIASLARETVYLYLSMLGLDEDSKIGEHSLMEQERRREEGDVMFLSALPDDFDAQVIATVRERAVSQSALLPVRA